jgi:hypothetical protein
VKSSEVCFIPNYVSLPEPPMHHDRTTVVPRLPLQSVVIGLGEVGDSADKVLWDVPRVESDRLVNEWPAIVSSP